MANDNTLTIIINGNAKKYLNELDKVKKQTADVEKVLNSVAKSSAIAFAGFAAAIAVSTKAFASYETALVGVGKTTNIEGKKLDDFGKKFQKLATEIPLSTNELLGIAQAAGQLGVEGEANLLKFTDTIAKLGVATDLTGEEAATSIARILNVTNEGIDTIDRFGAVIVALGNNSAATESEIVKMATEVSRSSAIFGVSAAEAAALGTALKATGQEAQLGGSVIGKTFLTIQKVIDGGGKQLENFAQLTGIAGDQLKQTFQDDATGVLQSFLSGLNNLEGGTSAIFAALEGFGLKGDEVNKVLPVLAKNTDLVKKSFDLANKEVRNATALNDEAAKAFDTLASRGKLTANTLTNIATNIGEQLAPAANELLRATNDLLKQINNLDKTTFASIATFLKWGAAISGGAAAIATFLIGAIKISGIIAGLSAVFLPATVAASSFWVALTGPIGIAVAGIAALTAGFFALKNTLENSGKTESLDEINKKLEEQRKALERNKKIAEDTGKDPNQSVAVQQIQERIDKLEELRQAKIAASEDFGTGELLKAPTAEPFDPSKTSLGFEEQTIPLKAGAVEGDGGVEEIKKQANEKIAIIDAATQKRIELAKAENDTLKELAQARKDGLLAEDIEFLQRKADIEAEFAEAKLIKNEEERALALENLRLKHEEELLAIEEKENLLDEQKAVREEERQALDDELKALRLEKENQFTEAEKKIFQGSIDSKSEAQKKYDTARIKKNIEVQNQFKQDEIRYGTEIAQIKKFMNSEELQGFKSTSAQLAQLSRSKNSTLKGIGKAAARTNAAIATAEGAIKAYTSLAGIPLIGPVLGAAAAAALVTYGVEQQREISRMATGGFAVPNGQGGARDRIPAMLEPNELVIPAAIAPNFIQAAGIPDTQSAAVNEGQGGSRQLVEIMVQDRAAEIIYLEQRESESLGLI